jgi:hypothetical protein
MHTVFWLASLKGRYHLEDLDVDGRVLTEYTGVSKKK